MSKAAVDEVLGPARDLIRIDTVNTGDSGSDIDERMPVSALEFSTRVLDRFFRSC